MRSQSHRIAFDRRSRRLDACPRAGGWALALLLVVLAASSCARPASGGDAPETEPLRALAAALGDHAPFELQLAAPLDRKPCAPAVRGGTDLGAPRQPWRARPVCPGVGADPGVRDEINRFARRLGGTLGPGSPAEAWRAFGIVKLLAAERPYEAVQHLERAARLAPGDAETLNDLGVARALLAIIEGEPLLVSGALDAFRDAAALAPGGPAAHNHAWLLERAGVANRVEGESGATPYELRQRFDGLLRAWVEALAARDETLAERRRDAAASAAAALARREDRWAADVVRALDATLAAGRGDDAVASFAAFERAEDLLRNRRPGEAAAAFLNARPRLERDLGPFALEARYQRFLALFGVSAYDEALAELAPLLAPDAERYVYRHAEALRLAGLVDSIRGDHGPALELWRRALELAHRARDAGLIVAVHRVAADALHLIGERQAAWEHLSLALELRPMVASDRGDYALYQAAAVVALDGGEVELASLFTERAVPLAESLDSVPWLVGALRFRALARHAAGEPIAALRDLANARQALRSEPSSAARASNEAELDLAEAEILADHDPARATELLAGVAERFAASEYEALRPRAHQLAARAYRHQRRFDAARREIELALALLDEQQDGLGETERWALHARRRAAYCEKVRLLAAAGVPAGRSLEVADRALGRAWEAWLRCAAQRSRAGAESGFAPRSVAPEAALAALPADAHFVELLALDDELYLWSARAGDVELRRVEVAHSELVRAVRGLRSAIAEARTSSAFHTPAEELYEWLIEPLEDRLIAGETLLFALPAELLPLPLAALLDPETGRFLIEDHPLAVVSNLAFAAALAERRELRGETSWENAVLVTAGEPAERLGQRLPALGWADDEAQSFVDEFPGETLRHEADRAHRHGLLAAAHDADVLYFIGHALARDGEPPRLVLAADPADPAAEPDLLPEHLMCGEATAPVRMPRLVVLSACETALTHYRQDLPSAFLAAGADAVVANVWNVDDEAIAELMSGLQRQLFEQQLAPPEALRRAQLEALAAGAPASVWAAGRVVGF